MAPPGAWWFAPDGWVGDIDGTGGLRGQCRCGKGRCAGTFSRNTAAGSVQRQRGKGEERLADRRCGKENRRPFCALLPVERERSPQR